VEIIKSSEIKPLPELIGAFKTVSSKKIHQIGNTNFKWQKSYYDHIIRKEQAYINIGNYIINNPLRWGEDIENRNGITKNRDEYYKQIFEKEEIRVVEGSE
jgi:hypothetical protein